VVLNEYAGNPLSGPGFEAGDALVQLVGCSDHRHEVMVGLDSQCTDLSAKIVSDAGDTGIETIGIVAIQQDADKHCQGGDSDGETGILIYNKSIESPQLDRRNFCSPWSVCFECLSYSLETGRIWQEAALGAWD